MNNTFGEILRLTIFGASHADEVGVIIEGVPKGIHLTPQMFADDINRRRPSLHGETTRYEEDIPTIEGLDAEGYTTENPLRISFRNGDIRSKDYSRFARHPRPSHADIVQHRKYGEDYNLGDEVRVQLEYGEFKKTEHKRITAVNLYTDTNGSGVIPIFEE